MAPMHVAPFPAIRIVLVKEVILPLVPHQPIGVIQPAAARREMELRAILFAVHRRSVWRLLGLHDRSSDFEPTGSLASNEHVSSRIGGCSMKTQKSGAWPASGSRISKTLRLCPPRMNLTCRGGASRFTGRWRYRRLKHNSRARSSRFRVWYRSGRSGRR